MADEDRSDDDHHPGTIEWRVHGHERRIIALERGADVLFGHRGQPGSLQAMSHRLDTHERRIGDLEQVRWKLTGASVIAGSVTAIVVALIIKLINQ